MMVETASKEDLEIVERILANKIVNGFPPPNSIALLRFIALRLLMPCRTRRQDRKGKPDETTRQNRSATVHRPV